MLATSSDTEFLRLREAAELARVDVRTIRRWVRLGLPSLSRGPGATRLVARRDLIDYVAGRIPNKKA